METATVYIQKGKAEKHVRKTCVGLNVTAVCQKGLYVSICTNPWQRFEGKTVSTGKW